MGGVVVADGDRSVAAAAVAGDEYVESFEAGSSEEEEEEVV